VCRRGVVAEILNFFDRVDRVDRINGVDIIESIDFIDIIESIDIIEIIDSIDTINQSMKFSPSSGYRRLDSWVLASIAQFTTYRFCEKFLDRKIDPTGRQYDQMTQAARSGKVNIVEGSSRAATSKETEMKLTDVARASLEELRSDYEDWFLRHDKAPWGQDNADAKAVFTLRLDPPAYGDDYVRDSCLHILAQRGKFAKWLESDDSFTVANALIVIIGRVIRMLERQLDSQGETFEREGGFREQLTKTRIESRARNDEAADSPVCPECGKAMRKRKAKTGANAGKEFWGCSGYPDCKGVRDVGGGRG